MGGQSSGYQSQPMNQWGGGQRFGGGGFGGGFGGYGNGGYMPQSFNQQGYGQQQSYQPQASAGTTTSPMDLAAGTNLADGRSSTAFRADGNLSTNSHKANSRSAGTSTAFDGPAPVNGRSGGTAGKGFSLLQTRT